jgi:hypothetical protein
VKHLLLGLLVLALLQQCQALSSVSGGSVGFQVPDNPFYFLWGDHGGGCISLIQLNITSPLNGTNFYFPDVTSNVTFTLNGTTTPTCYYRLRVGGAWYAWNDWSGCEDGDESVNHKTVTLPINDNVTIQVRVVDGYCTEESAVVVSVIKFVHGNTLGTGLMMFLPLLLVILIILLDRKKKKRR